MSRTCDSCGTPVPANLAMTVAETTPPPSLTPVSRPATSATSRPRFTSTSVSDGRFPPGAMLAERYRIVALLGRGGMGEVYRAEDLTLGQAVALKFLPEAMAQNESALARFYNEVRIARQVSHPNVCRVYDLGEAEGQPYLSMEYVDGEDLGALLRRIGRLPGDKGLEIARKLCAGLAAAHDKGVLHRDLKPSNIMLDARGQVLITDFGLAGAADQIQGLEIRNGTPAYMAPEQLAGTEVSAASDIYALGLVLYEIFTGKRAYEAQNVAELVRLQTQGKPPSMTTLARDIDPSVERVILRCLDPDPRNRPSSALAVAAALPGGDPLAAALAAGETPSPQMVAAAGENTAMRPRNAVICLAVFVVGLVAMLALGHNSVLNRVNVELPPDALRIKAREMLKQFGYTERPRDFAYGFRYADGVLAHAEKQKNPRPDWNKVLASMPSAVRFWYRESPRELQAVQLLAGHAALGVISQDDPPFTQPGMVRLLMDSEGRLVSLLALPDERESPPGQPLPVDWNLVLKAAGFDPAQLTPAPPEWTSLAASDTRVAWTGVFPGPQKWPLRVEAAAWRGKLVFLSTIGPWTEPHTGKPAPPKASERITEAMFVVLALSLFGWAGYLSWRNHSLGRSDERGAFRLALAVLVLKLVTWLVVTQSLTSSAALTAFYLAASNALFASALVWMLYMALEPFVRRRWPQTLISWNRVLAGRFRDPLVGRDVLFGLVMASVWFVMFAIRQMITEPMGDAPWRGTLGHLQGPGATLATWLGQIPASVQGTLMFFFLLLGLRIVLRKQWLAVAAFASIFVILRVLDSQSPAVDAPLIAAIYIAAAVCLVRFGVVTLAVGVFAGDLLLPAPLTLNTAAWFFPITVALVLSLLAIAVLAFHTAVAGRPLLKEEWFN